MSKGTMKNKTDIKAILIKKQADYLADLVLLLLADLPETKQLDFISKHINAGVALKSLTKDDKEVYLNKISTFCECVLDGQYYEEPAYDDWSDSYNEEQYTDSDWAKELTEYLRLATFYARNDEKIAVTALNLLMTCINKCSHDFEILGTDEPLSYVDIDANDVFDAYFSAILSIYKDEPAEAYKRIITLWQDFHYYANPVIHSWVKNYSVAKDVVYDLIKVSFSFYEREKLFHLLKEIYDKNEVIFDEISHSVEIVSLDVNFNLYLAGGYFKAEQWQFAIVVINANIDVVTDKVKDKMLILLTDAYDHNGEQQKAYDTALGIFHAKCDYWSYKRTRQLAENVVDVGAFIAESVAFILRKQIYHKELLVCSIYSFDNKIDELIAVMNERTGDNYDICKYVSKSLVHKAFYGEQCDYANINEYNVGSEATKLQGIVDCLPSASLNITALMEQAIIKLQFMVKFHVDAANRSRYTRAAYYCGVVCDLFSALGREKDRREYIAQLMKENNRRPAFKDEMRQKFGKGI